MNWRVRVPEGLRIAVRALKKEILGFRFDYPLQIVPQGAANDSLHYHLYSDWLAWEALCLDPDGIPQAWYRSTGAVNARWARSCRHPEFKRHVQCLTFGYLRQIDKVLVRQR